MENITVEELKELGLEDAGSELLRLQEKKRKLTTAYEFHRVVPMAAINQFQKTLRKKSEKKHKDGSTEYETLRLTPLKNWKKVPPQEARTLLKEAIGRNCFDYFEVAHIESVVERPDPIIFGRITDVTDLFVVAQWDNDIKVSDLIKETEG